MVPAVADQSDYFSLDFYDTIKVKWVLHPKGKAAYLTRRSFLKVSSELS